MVEGLAIMLIVFNNLLYTYKIPNSHYCSPTWLRTTTWWPNCRGKHSGTSCYKIKFQKIKKKVSHALLKRYILHQDMSTTLSSPCV